MQDLLVIGGGVNGAGIARDAAGRGMAVTLVEKDDLASHTSSASTKLVHGGLRYLEQGDVRLVREALAEREVLLRIAAHIVRPLRFVLPHHGALRPRWMLRLGLALYDRLGGANSLPRSRKLALTTGALEGVLQPRFATGFAYSDCWVEDARLVVLNAMDARDRGARIITRNAVTALAREPGHWIATLADGETIAARMVVNAAGPWADDVVGLAGIADPHLRLVKGSHIVVPRIYRADNAFIFQNGDGRIIFAIPYERDYTLIGTTDRDFSGDRDDVRIDAEEIAYLCDAASDYFADPVEPRDVVSAYSGVRPLYEDGDADNSQVTRDYAFTVDARADGPPILSVYGGKITTYRKLAEVALARFARHGNVPAATWTADAPLPGAAFPEADLGQFVIACKARYPWMPHGQLLRLTRSYGTRIREIVGDATGIADLGKHLGADLYSAELHYLVKNEFAKTAEDALWRRSKLGLHLSGDDQARVEAWFAENAARLLQNA